MNFIESLEQYLPEIKERMNPANSEAAIDKIEKEIGEALPDSFKALYAEYNGEKNDPITGVMMGFSLMDIDNILENMNSFKEDDFSEITSLTTGKVSDEKMCDRIMVPFAWDGSRGFFCLDMSPDTKGKKGQVVALDYDYDECTLLADSLDEFYEFIHQMLKSGKCYVDTEESDEPYFNFESGHFFNVMKDVLREFMKTEGEEDAEVDLPEVFWREEFGADKVPVSTLQKQTRLMISNGEMTISLSPVVHMSKLRELIIHHCTITDFEKICNATELKKLVLVNCNFEYEKLAELSKLTKLKQLTFRLMPLTDISCLTEIKSLKQLRLIEMNQLDTKNLDSFSKLQELELEKMEIDSLDFLKGYKALKVLELNKVKVSDLEFLQYLKKLTRFKLRDNVADESGLRFLKDLKQIKEFDYPVGDMALYASCEKLEDIGINAAKFQNPEALKGSSITSVMVYNANSEEEANSVIERVKEHVKLYSYGMTGAFLG